MASGEELAALRAWLRQRLGEYAEVPAESIRLEIRFRDLGLHSVQVLSLLEALSTHVGRTIPANAAWEHPTPEALAQYVLGLASEQIVCAQGKSAAPGGSNAPKPSTNNDTAVAIVGMACRLPGGVRCADDLWALLREGRSGVSEVPKHRFDVDRYFDADPSTPGKLSTRYAGMIDDVGSFDAAFFGISHREARQMDPQQRIVLELAWHALEDAGIDPTSVKGAKIGVFVGAMWSDYARLLHRDPNNIDAHSATGQDTSIISGRVSYSLGISGPSLTVNTACSSSAVAVHLALQSLRRGEVDLALVGGVHLIASPESTVALTKFGAMNPAGQCRSFDAAANGYVRGEGAGLLLLKPLPLAIADGDDIYCCIRGSAMNNDGFSNGLTAPNPHAQEAVIRQALADAGVEPETIDYVETHGPGTILGDPLEAGALGAVFAASRKVDESLRIGSIKTNLGHLEAGAGIAGIMKVALCLRHKQLVPNLHFERPNPHIPFERLRLEVQTALESWPDRGRVARAGVSSFGFGGTNCHIVLEAAPTSSSMIVPLSASSHETLRERALSAVGLLSRGAGARETSTLALQLARRCQPAPFRDAVVANNAPELIRKLTGIVASAARAPSSRAAGSGKRPRLVFVCPGQGAHWHGMMRASLAWEPEFRRAFAECERVVLARCGWSVTAELFASEALSNLHRPEVAQLIQLSVQLSLGALWRAWGVQPDAIVGHSLGEIAACCLAGILTLPDAVRIVAERARLMDVPEAQGGMLSVMMREPAQLEQAIQLASPLELAAHNSPLALVFAGSAERVAQARLQLEAAGISANPVRNVPLAGHSSHMDSVQAALRLALSGLTPGRANIPVRSTVNEAWLEGPECGPEYWADNVRKPVRFRQAVETLCGEGPTIFLELGAHPVLLKAVAQTAAREHITLASCHRGEDERGSLLETLAELFRRGFAVDFTRVSGADEPISDEAQLALERSFGSAPLPLGSATLAPALISANGHDALEQLLDRLHASIAPLQPGSATLAPVIVSANGRDALEQQLDRLHASIAARPGLALPEVASALVCSRASLPSRALFLARDRADLLSLLRSESSDRVLTADADPSPALGLLFTGQGSQRVGMGQALARALPSFRAALHSIVDAFEAEAQCALRAVLFAAAPSPEAKRIHRTELAQPALFALEVALYRTLETLQLRPSWLLGHSIGEIAAAHVAGVMSLRDACVLVAARGRLMQRLPDGGAMLSLQASEDEALAWCDRFAGKLSLAAINGPHATVLSGDENAIERMEQELRAAGREATRLRVSHAFHSFRMEPMLEAFGEVVSSLTLAPAQLPIVSSVTGTLAAPNLFSDPAYWVRQVREPVRFHAAVQALLSLGARHFLELGPRPVLAPLVSEHARAWSVLSSGADESESLLRALAELHVHGHAVDFSGWLPAAQSCPRVRLPGYAFRREHHWIEREPEGDGDTSRRAGLYALRWVAAPMQPSVKARVAVLGMDYVSLTELADAVSGGERAPDWLVLPVPSQSEPLPHTATCWLLEQLQRLLADERLANVRCMIVTRAALTVDMTVSQPGALAHAPIWGLTRCVRREYPDRELRLLDIAADDPIELAARALQSDEQELVARAGKLFAPRLSEAEPRSTSRPDFTRGTVLITGGSGALAQLLAQHLVEQHGARHVLMCSRTAVAAARAEVEVASCDVSDRAALRALIASIPSERPLIAVFHAAAVVDDAVFAAQNPQRLDRVLAAKWDGAWHLHELTRELPLQAFVMFSSAVGLLGHGGQSNYAAANAALDALAMYRHALGLPATSIAWGYWARPSRLTRQLTAADRARFEREGMRALSDADGLALLDQALGRGEPLLCAAHFDRAALAQQAQAPRLLSELLPSRAVAVSPSLTAAWAERLASAAQQERAELALAGVLSEVSAVMATPTEAIAVDRPLRDSGLDSLMALELKNRLSRATGLSLPATLLYDHPTVEALACAIDQRLQPLAARPQPQPVPAVSGDQHEPIAIVALSCRCPGGVETPEALWELLRSGSDAIDAFPQDRGWALDRLFADDPDAVGKSYARAGGFLRDVAGFDPELFDITPREALAMDPQQRLLLELSLEAFQRAGVDESTLAGSPTGVFVGLNYHDYVEQAKGQSDELEGYVAIGSAGSVAAGRIAYHFGLEGPALCVDTACSSSLVALHLACQALRRGECSSALAGGVTVMSTPDAFVEFSRQRGLAADGRSKAFSARADGVGWGEGAGMLLLEPLSAARARGHQVLGLIRGSAVNQDGRSQGLTAPSGPAQERVIRAALEDASLASVDVDAVEAHGTGTRLGDPIELQALIAAYSPARPAEPPLWIGSLKSNIGHAQSAAGVLGVIKMVLALQHGELPATLHAEEPTPHVDWAQQPVRLLQRAQAWERGVRPRRAGVSAFGIGGTNAHVIVEEPPPSAAASAQGETTLPYVLSAHSPAALQAMAAQLSRHLRGECVPRLDDIAYTLGCGRKQHALRVGFAAKGVEDLIAKLDAVAVGRGPSPSAPQRDQKLTVLFSGQGSQRAAAGRQLYESSPLFRSKLEHVIAGFHALDGRALLQCMFADPTSPHATGLDRTEYAQPALFALEVALYRSIEALGVRPQLLLGHSVGEIAAAHVASVLSLEDACELVTARGRLMQALPEGGAMFALQASHKDVVTELPESGAVVVAAVNGADNVVISGDLDAAQQIAQRFAAHGCKVRRLRVSHAFHSPRMLPMLEQFEAVISQLQFRPAELPIVSSLTGELLDASAMSAVDYWSRQLRGAVLFQRALESAAGLGASTFLELGPGAVLSAFALAALPSARVCPTLVENEEESALASAQATAYVAGGKPRIEDLLQADAQRVVLPTYPFQRRRFWPKRTEAPALRLDADDLDDLTATERGAVELALPLLAAREQQRRSAAQLDDKRYVVRWRELPSSDACASGVWWLLASDHDDALAAQLEAALVGRGMTVVLQRITGQAPTLPHAQKPARIVILATDAALAADATTPRAALLLTAATQAWLLAGKPGPLWLVTRGAAQVDPADAAPCVEQALVSGLARVVALEHPDGWGGTLDLDARSMPEAQRIIAALSGSGSEDELALRDRRVLGRRLVREGWAANKRVHFTGAALITGGTGALGRQLARWLAQRGITHVMLSSRSGDQSPGIAALERELAALGARLSVRALDVCDRGQLAQLLDALRAESLPLEVVVHAAGVNGVVPVAELQAEQLTSMLRAKVLGARHLDELLRDDPPRHFLLFASGAGVWGSAGRAAYAAANAYLDALAQRRAALGLPATSIAWGLWAGDGMASVAIEQMKRVGALALPPELALRALERALGEGAVQLCIADFAWETFAAVYSATRERALLSEIVVAAAPAASSSSDAQALSSQLQAAAPAQRQRLVLQMVCGAMADVLGVDAASVQPHTPLKDLGMDSLMAVKLRNRLMTLTGERLPATLLFNYPSPSTLAGYLSSKLAPASAPLNIMDELARLEQLDADVVDADAAELLKQRLQALMNKWRLPFAIARNVLQPLAAVAEDESIFDGADDEQLMRLVDESIDQQGL
jgi:acyl transferase domain-containing protein/acyl carrier protein